MTDTSPREATAATTATGVIVAASMLLTLSSHAAWPHPVALALAVATVLLAAGSFLIVRRRILAHRPAGPAWWGCLAAAALSLASMCLASQWGAAPLAMAGLSLGAATTRRGTTSVLALLAGTAVAPLASRGAGVPTTVGIVITVGLVAVVLHALTRLLVLADDLRRSQAEVARLEVEQERARISRDLHDVIGRTMTAASLRNQAALALVDLAPERAAEQIQATHDALAQGQARLREITRGPIVAGLHQELDATAGLCGQLGITLDLRADNVEEPAASQLAARVVREAVTNLLKHSRPHHCAVTVKAMDQFIHVTVDNDGCPDTPPRTAGTGLRDLTARVERAGGHLEADQRDGHFILSCQIPTPEQP